MGEWQPIEESGYPDKFENSVDVWCSRTYEDGPRLIDGYRTTDCVYLGGKWVQEFEGMHIPAAGAGYTVTHFMPYPNPPE